MQMPFLFRLRQWNCGSAKGLTVWFVSKAKKKGSGHATLPASYYSYILHSFFLSFFPPTLVLLVRSGVGTEKREKIQLSAFQLLRGSLLTVCLFEVLFLVLISKHFLVDSNHDKREKLSDGNARCPFALGEETMTSRFALRTAVARDFLYESASQVSRDQKKNPV